MRAADLRALQAPLKTRYRETPAAAQVTSHAEAELRPGAVQVGVRVGEAFVEAGLHPATGGDGTVRCSGDMLLDALVACAGVTLQAVAIAMGVTVKSGHLRAEGDWDARGTLGLSREVPVGCTAVRVMVSLDSNATPDQLAKLLELTERYCVVAQTLNKGVPVEVRGEEPLGVRRFHPERSEGSTHPG
jgi:uncharacterized OsmC-like protein